MLRHRLHSKREKPTTPINWKLRAANQTTAKNHQRKSRHEKANPRRAAQAREKLQHLRRDDGNDSDSDSDESNVPMLKERPQTFAILLCLHSVRWPNRVSG